jgi:hypothetical protein
MGLLGKLSEMRMKDPVEGTCQVVGINYPDPMATSQNYRMECVVTAPGIDPTATTHKGMCSTAKWPGPGDELPITIDRSNPEHFVVHWDQLRTGREEAMGQAQAVAEEMRSGASNISAACDRISAEVARISADRPELAERLAGIPDQLEAIKGQALTNPAEANAAIQALVQQIQTIPAPVKDHVSAADVLAHGVRGQATLLGTFACPEPSGDPARTAIGLMLNVAIAGQAPSDVRNYYKVPNAKLSALVPGATLPVAVDSGDQTLVAVDWDAV